MSKPSMIKRTARCVCGGVEIETTGEPIVSNACYCDDCQKAAAESITQRATSAGRGGWN